MERCPARREAAGLLAVDGSPTSEVLMSRAVLAIALIADSEQLQDERPNYRNPDMMFQNIFLRGDLSVCNHLF
jgi:hypothetical protein